MRLSYLQQGFGDNLPVVLLHPFPLNARFWSNQLSGLSRQRHIIALNFRGYGATRVESGDEFSVERFAGDIRKSMNTAQVPKAIFVGCSMGGYVLFELWRQAPELVGGMVFIDTRAEADTPQAHAKRMDLIEHVRNTGTADLPDIAEGFLSETTRQTRADVVNDVRNWAAEPSCDVIIKTIEMLARRPDSTSTLATITVPTLVIVGEEDQVTPPDAAVHIADGIEDAQLVRIPDAGHLSPIETPHLVNKAISEFIGAIS
jgi:pimeloyl-ACP methyl ester carboxylesterase